MHSVDWRVVTDSKVKKLNGAGKEPNIYQCIILGGGMAGCTCALYLGDANIPHLLVTGPSLGALQESPSIRNFPSQNNVPGLEIMQTVRSQAQSAGSWLVSAEMTRVSLERDLNNHCCLRVWIKQDASDQEIALDTLSLVIAMGSKARRHDAKYVEHMWGHGVYSCAICDGSKFRDKEVVVVGGGDAAVGMALYLSRLSSKVYILLRGTTWKAKDIKSLEKLLSLPNVQVLKETILEEVVPYNMTNVKEGLDHVLVSSEGKTYALDAKGVFLGIGSDPLTEAFQGQLKLDEDNYIIVDDDHETSVPGVFAVGEICSLSKPYKQAITAASDGCKASFGVRDLLSEFPQTFLDQDTRRTPPPFLVSHSESIGKRPLPSRDGHKTLWMPLRSGHALPHPSVVLFHQEGCFACEKMLKLLPDIVRDFPSIKMFEYAIEGRYDQADSVLRSLTKDPKDSIQGVPVMLLINRGVEKIVGAQTPDKLRRLFTQLTKA